MEPRQQQSGGVFQQTEQTSNALYISGYGAYALARNLQLNFDAQRRQQTFLGKTYGADTFGGGATYTRELLGGSMNASVNFADNTSDQSIGNALSFTTNFGYNRTFGDWGVGGDVSYAQNVQTFLLTYMNSFYVYSANVRHRFGRIIWTASASGSHSAIVEPAEYRERRPQLLDQPGRPAAYLCRQLRQNKRIRIAGRQRNNAATQSPSGRNTTGMAAALRRVRLFVFPGNLADSTPNAGRQSSPGPTATPSMD